MKMIALLLLYLAGTAACSDATALQNESKGRTPLIKQVDKVSVASGDIVAVTGANLGYSIVAKIDGTEVPFNLETSKTANLVIPTTTHQGISHLTFSYSGEVLATYPLLMNVKDNEIQASLLTAGQVCDDTSFKGAEGLTRGTRNCSPSPKFCSTDGEVNCLTVEAFPSIDKAAALNPDSIKTGVVIAGVTGRYPSAAAPIAGSSLAVTDLNSLDTTTAVGTYEFFDSMGARYIGSIADGGTVTPGVSNQTIAAANTVYRKVVVSGDSNLSVGNVKSGVGIFGVTGQYPSSTYTLPSASGTADLDAATFNAKVKSATAFEYWDSAGGYQTGAGSANITAANIVTGVSIFGSGGTAPADCLYGTQGSCQADTKCSWTGSACEVDPWNIRAGVTLGGKAGALKTSCRNRGSSSTWDTGLPYAAVFSSSSPMILVTGHQLSDGDMVRIDGSTVPTGLTLRTQTYFVVNSMAGISLQLSFTIGGAAITPSTAGGNVNIYKWMDGTVQWWDTIDDFNNFLAFPTALVSGWTSSNDCSSADWQDLTADGTCDAAADDCMMKDKISGLTWSESYPVTGAAAASTTESWFSAIRRCNILNFGGYATGWRLPTQKELMDAYVHGIRDVGSNGAGVSTGSTNLNANFIADVDADSFWSASIASDDGRYAWNVYLNQGFTTSTNKPTAYLVLCVR